MLQRCKPLGNTLLPCHNPHWQRSSYLCWPVLKKKEEFGKINSCPKFNTILSVKSEQQITRSVKYFQWGTCTVMMIQRFVDTKGSIIINNYQLHWEKTLSYKGQRPTISNQLLSSCSFDNNLHWQEASGLTTALLLQIEGQERRFLFKLLYVKNKFWFWIQLKEVSTTIKVAHFTLPSHQPDYKAILSNVYWFWKKAKRSPAGL